MALDKEKLLVKLKELSPEDRNEIRSALEITDSESFLSKEEVLSLREILTKVKKKENGKKKGIADLLDSLFD